MRLRTKIFALLAVPAVALLGTVAFAFGAQRGSDASLLLVEHTYQVKETLNAVFDDLVDAETGMRGYLLTGRDSFLTPYTEGTAVLGHDLDRLAFLVRDEPLQIRHLRDLRLLASERLRILEMLRPYAPIDAVKTFERVDPILEDGRRVMDQIRALVDRMVGEQNRLLGIHQAALDDARHRSFLAGTVALPAGAVICLAGVFGSST